MSIDVKFVKVYTDENGEYCRLTIDEVNKLIDDIKDAYEKGYEDGFIECRKDAEAYYKPKLEQLEHQQIIPTKKPDWYKDNWWTNPTITCGSDIEAHLL